MKPGRQLLMLTPGPNVKRYAFSALNTRTGRVVHGVTQRNDAATFTQFLQCLSRAYRKERKLHLVFDNYIIHKAACVQRYLATPGCRTVLHFLPPLAGRPLVLALTLDCDSPPRTSPNRSPV